MSGHKPFGVDHDDVQCGGGGGWLAWLLMILHKCLLFLLLWNEGRIVRCGGRKFGSMTIQEHHLQGSLLKSPVVITLETKPTRDFHGFIKLVSSIFGREDEMDATNLNYSDQRKIHFSSLNILL
jgi:hypothetical protein